MSKVWYLSSEPLLNALPDEDVSRLFQLMHTSHYEANRTVFSANVPGDVIYTVRQGSLRFIQITSAGSTRRCATLRKGDIFGSLELVDQGFKRAQISTETPVQLLVLRKPAFEKLIKFYPAMGSRLVNFLKAYLGHHFDTYHREIAIQSRQRILRMLYHTFSHPDYQGDPQTVSACSPRELAELTGSSVEAVEIVLENLQQKKLLQLKGGGIKILKPELLPEMLSLCTP
ncbi:hypothetical protein COW36_18800 [bacterium (Candidatus Blackallbacteria) CG17_big_fil_post_rev_8_21_14_2_50_48_46]|uniref:Cyclic nucleotide-binding domain-containing protein n=1 Tax=bacterium (Candidatus Blackallbacteria) CG17_big_fil_post_rev_8_21_14_2_50_48_46 TaxID=2014261 RepID=A0A2M7FZW0_9BACT|nr:MAG: hypothetical protein COW64_25670 [bacterium (Candidatus Blackallbacteria) CG18_big_fil_WC_8_21_14_2_50_49_26]PIW14976.1 MAG: hypothetical protein COW36_18800 [bacterium (Candidatus Blackallbacteria) CG17_big_fil_post_rev_8_21_14_2_50_48_46]PIW50057.1 MAG: hypothetical protein COW20_03735 [bacterium (Candidatus Blackallbacteria) CG13_big_fil_rev_8_21_14_2_50_49_14]